METDDVSFELITKIWLETIKLTAIADTYELYSSKLKKYILPKFGKEPLSKITVKQINKFVTELYNNKFSDSYIRGIVLVLEYVGTFAFENMNIPNVCKKANHNIVKQKSEFLDTSEETKLLNYVGNDSHLISLGIWISLYTGVSLSELSALKWGNIDWINNRISVTQTAQRVPNLNRNKNNTKMTVFLSALKKSYRSVPIIEKLFDKLYAQRGNEDCYIMSGTIEIPDPLVVRNRLNRNIREAGVQGASFGILRTTFLVNFSNIYGVFFTNQTWLQINESQKRAENCVFIYMI